MTHLVFDELSFLTYHMILRNLRLLVENAFSDPLVDIRTKSPGATQSVEGTLGRHYKTPEYGKHHPYWSYN